MKRDLTPEQLAQQVTLSLPLSAVLRLAEDEANPFVDPASKLGRYAILGDVLPKIGEEWQDGVYAGITVYEHAPMALILLNGESKSIPWKDALEWAKQHGGELPTRIDALTLWQNLPKEFKEEWYWTSEEYARNAAFAWIQTFGNGYQGSDRKVYDYRCRAVRRVAI